MYFSALHSPQSSYVFLLSIQPLAFCSKEDHLHGTVIKTKQTVYKSQSVIV